MSTLTSITLVCLFLLAGYQIVDGLACYSCSNCNDPFNPTYVLVQYQNDTVPSYCVKTSTANYVTRNLATNCTPSSTIGNGVWCCQSNLCNHGQRNSLNHAFCFGIGALALMMLV